MGGLQCNAIGYGEIVKRIGSHALESLMSEISNTANLFLMMPRPIVLRIPSPYPIRRVLLPRSWSYLPPMKANSRTFKLSSWISRRHLVTCTQTETVLRPSLVERVKLNLFVNKVDRCILEFQMEPKDMYREIWHGLTRGSSFWTIEGTIAETSM